jgi:hypothetical protein
MYAKGDELWSEEYDKAAVDSIGSVSLVNIFVSKLIGSVEKHFIHQIKLLGKTNGANSEPQNMLPSFEFENL